MMEFTLQQTLGLLAALSCMSVVLDGDEANEAIEYMTDKILQYNKDHFNVPIPDRSEPRTYPEDMELRLQKFIDDYNTEFLQKIIEKLIYVENRDNMEEDKTTT